MTELDLCAIMDILPQRFPFLMIDRVLSIDPGKKAVAVKNVTANEKYFQGHFPGAPVMPGALIIEAMAQTSILIYHSAYKNDLAATPQYFLGSVKTVFKHPAFPGDQVRFEAEAVRLMPTGAFVNVKAYINDTLIAESDLVFAVKR